MFLNQVFELTMTLDAESFAPIFEKARHMDEEDDWLIDRSLSSN